MAILIDGVERPRNRGINVPRCGRCDNHMKGSRSMKQVTTIGLDLAKQVFQVHSADTEGSPIFSRKLRRAEVLRFFEKSPPCLVGMEACGGAHHLSRKLKALGHDARLMPAKYVRPYSEGQKNDFRDAEAIAATAAGDSELPPLGSVGIQDSHPGLVVIQAEDGPIRFN